MGSGAVGSGGSGGGSSGGSGSAATEALETKELKEGSGRESSPRKSERDPEANLLLSARVTSVPVPARLEAQRTWLLSRPRRGNF